MGAHYQPGIDKHCHWSLNIFYKNNYGGLSSICNITWLLGIWTEYSEYPISSIPNFFYTQLLLCPTSSIPKVENTQDANKYPTEKLGYHDVGYSGHDDRRYPNNLLMLIGYVSHWWSAVLESFTSLDSADKERFTKCYHVPKQILNSST